MLFRPKGTSLEGSTMEQIKGEKVGRVTLREIARDAGVSITTASVVLSGKGVQERISPEVIERVLTCARQNDYAPNLLVRSMQKGRTHIIGFYNSFRTYFPRDYYYNNVKEGLEIGVRRHGYNLLLFCAPETSIENLYQQLNGGLCDGLILFGPHQDDPLLPLLRQSRMPSVLLNHIDSEGILSSVTDDWQEGIRQIATSLYELGHRRIGAITSEPGHRNDAAVRVKMLGHALGSLGISLRTENIAPLKAYNLESAIDTVSTLMAQPEPPTAIFCWHDMAGYDVLRACRHLGIKVPEQLSLVGYDGIQWQSEYGHWLSSVHVDIVRQSTLAVDVLDRLVQGEVKQPIQQVCPILFQPGTTLAPPASV